MAAAKESQKDPLIDEIRERRRELLAAHGFDLQRLYEAIRCLQKEHPEKVKDRRKRLPSAR